MSERRNAVCGNTPKGATSSLAGKNSRSDLLLVDEKVVTPLPPIPPTLELFGVRELSSRHPNLLTVQRLEWALRNRETNGLKEARAVFESRSGKTIIHEPPFLRWWLGLTGRRKPRSSPRSRRRARSKDVSATVTDLVNT